MTATRRSSLLLLSSIAAGCTGAPSRSLEVVTYNTNVYDTGPTAYVPGADTADTDTGVQPYHQAMTCGADLSDPLEDGDIAINGCVRVTPEPDDAGTSDSSTWTDTGPPPLDTGAVHYATAPPPPPCGFFNLIGAVALSGTPTNPDILYCDADVGGGLRHVVADPTNDNMSSELLVPDQCWVDTETGGMMTTGDATSAYWVYVKDLTTDDGDIVYTAPFGSDGITAEPTAISGSNGARRALPVNGAVPTLITQDMDNAVWAIPIDNPGAKTAVKSSVWSLGVAPGLDNLVVAMCMDYDSHLVEVSALDATGAVAWNTTLTAAICGYDARPDIAVNGDEVAVAWDDGDKGWVALLDSAGAEKARIALGKDAVYPRVAWYQNQLYTLDGAGFISMWDADGNSLGAWRNVAIADHAGDVEGLRLKVDDDGVTYLLIGSDYVPAGGGHINTYYYLEASGSPLPTP